MRDIKKALKKEDFDEIFKLYSTQSWLCDKEDSLIELFQMCETNGHKGLIISLLREFKYLDSKALGHYLNLIAEFIIEESGFTEETTQVSAITYDDEADSSQKVLDYIKIIIYEQGWDSVQTVNRFGAIPGKVKKGLTQIVFIDEFIGSGQTILGRIKQLKNDVKTPFELKLCFIAGMEQGIKLVEEMGFEVYCPLRMPKAISDRFNDSDFETAVKLMYQLEAKLATKIKDFELPAYSFGFNAAEAIYSLESCFGNTPNSVFPVFWWPRYVNDKPRKTILKRFEKGLK